MVTTLKSETVRSADGSFPLATPVTVVTPAIVISDVVTPTTLAKIGSLDEEVSEYSTKLFSFILPGNSAFALVTVLTPAEKPVIEADPTVNAGVCTTLAVNVLRPTILFPPAPCPIPVSE